MKPISILKVLNESNSNKTFDYNGTKCWMEIGTYSQAPTVLAIQFYCDEGPYTTATVNLGEDSGNDSVIPFGASFLDTNNNSDIVEELKKLGLGDVYTRFGEEVTAQSGFCEYPLFQFNVDKLKEYDPSGFSKYESSYRANLEKARKKLLGESYRYVTTHGTGPGTLPKDVNLIKSEDINSNGRVAIYVDRPLTKEELEKYDIRPEWIQESVTWDSITGSDQTAVEYFLGNFKNQCIDEEDFESNVRSSCNEIGWANEDLINQGYWDSSCGPKEDADPNYENVRDYLLTYHKDDIYKED